VAPIQLKPSVLHLDSQLPLPTNSLSGDIHACWGWEGKLISEVHVQFSIAETTVPLKIVAEFLPFQTEFMVTAFLQYLCFHRWIIWG
jgi:hypothetical protein